MSELSEMTTFWASVKGFVASAVGSVFREEEAVDVGPGSVTVRPYGEEGTQELRTMAGAMVRPGDRVVVLRLPALKLVLGTPTVRGVASVIPLPFGGYGGRYGVAETAARADHTHSTEDIIEIANVFRTYTPFSTPNNATIAAVDAVTISGVPAGVWSFSVTTEATMYRSVGTGEMYLQMRMTNNGSRDTDLYEQRNIPVTAVSDKEAMRLPFSRHARIKFDTPGTVTFTVGIRGDGTTGTTYAKQVLVTGHLRRVG